MGETQGLRHRRFGHKVSARLHGFVDDVVEVKEPGGVLTLRWHGEGNVFLTGPAAYVYSGEWPE